MCPYQRLHTHLVEGAHGCTRRRNDVVDEEEECVFGSKVNALANEEVELSDGQVGWHEILLLVEITYSCFRRFLHNHLATTQTT